MLKLIFALTMGATTRAALPRYEVYANERRALKALMIELRAEPLVLFYGTHSPDQLIATLANGPVFQILGRLDDLPREHFSELEQIDFAAERRRVRDFMAEMNARAHQPVDLNHPRVMRLRLDELSFSHDDHQPGSEVLAPPAAAADVERMIARTRLQIERIVNRVECRTLLEAEKELKRLHEAAQARGRALWGG